MTRVHVLIPAYNCASYISDAINSVLTQSFPDFRLTIVDNSSTDNTVAVVGRFKDPRIQCVQNARNIGAISNHNRCLELASGEFAKLLSADDVLLPGTIEKQLKAMEANASAGIVTCNAVVTDKNLMPMGFINYLPGFWLGRKAVTMAAKRAANVIGAPSNIMIRLAKLGGARFDHRLRWVGDLDFACQILGAADYINIDEPGFLYRRHGDSDSEVSCPAAVRLRDELIFASTHGRHPEAYLRIAARHSKAQARRMAIFISRLKSQAG
jgi:glycosyltransferase involved in cell wall biosynthesis